jgi:glycosyltransferase involved in cell wall biosynthesis
MKISIVVPCYNMENFIEESLLSIINQNYANLELIIVDGKSTDRTLEIISKYDKYISLLISEKDEGQYNAINKGFSKATGDVFAWLNADDIYFSWTLKHVSDFFKEFPDQSWVSGATSLMNEDGYINSFGNNVIAKPQQYLKNGWFRSDLYGSLQQEGMFWRKELWETSGGLDENYKLAADFELWTRFAIHKEPVSFALPLACFRDRASSRSRKLFIEYEAEVAIACKDLRQRNFLIQRIARLHIYANVLLRKFTFCNGIIYYYSPINKKWKLVRKTSSLSTHSFSKLLFLR